MTARPDESAFRGDGIQPEKLLELLILSSVDGILAFDRECRYTVWNPGMERISGVSASDTLGRRAFEVFPFLSEIGEDVFFHAALAGESAVARDRPFTIPDTGKDGFFEGHYSPLRDTDGEVIGGLAIIRDITQRKRDEEAVRASEVRLRTALDASGLGVWEWDIVGNRIEWSDEVYAMFGVSPETFDASYEGFVELIHPDDREHVQAKLAEVLEGPRADFQLEHRVAPPGGGGVRWIGGTGRLLRDEAGAPQRVLGTVLDISEQKRFQLERIRSQRAESVGRLAGGVAHDFNNLLTAIVGFAQLLKRPTCRPRDARAYADEIVRAADRGAELTQQLLAFARRQVVQPRVVDVNLLIHEATALLERVIGEQVALETDLAPDPCLVRVDPGQLEQVLVNLAVNARDAMPGGGRLRIGSRLLPESELVEAGAGVPGERRGRPWVGITVEDTGVGISPEDQQLIFEPFFTTKAPGEGSGLGLSICFGIVGQAGGRIDLSSAVGEGTRVRVAFPRCEDEPDARTAGDGGDVLGGAETILLVEDDELVRRSIHATLEEAGYRVLVAKDGVEGLELIGGRDDLQLLITDVVMPRAGGLELAEQVAERGGLPILFMSGYADGLDMSASPITDENFMQKPFSAHALLEKVRELLDAASGEP